jgi:hypothetical protein
MFLKLVDDLRTAFAGRGYTDVFIDEGLRARASQENYGAGLTNRIVFRPSESPMTMLPPTHIGDDDTGKRQLFNVEFVYEVSFAGFDANHPDRDIAHMRRCFDLWEVTAQEVQKAEYGLIEWTSARWELSRKDGVHGAELIATLALNIPIFDKAGAFATPAPVPGQPKPVT